jgi:lycopene beta-cyclase
MDRRAAVAEGFEHDRAGRGFWRPLSRMPFSMAEPDQRYEVLLRFYALSQPLIEWFYAAAIPLRDQARILAGKPPVPIGRAVGCLNRQDFLKATAARRRTLRCCQ